MPRNLVTPFSRSPRTGPSMVGPPLMTKSGAPSAWGFACTLPISPHNNASAIPILRIFASLLLLALDVSNDLPDFVRRHLVSPGRHAARRAFRNGVINLSRLAAILPTIVGQIRPHAAGQIIGMAAGTVHLAEQGVTGFHRIGLAFKRIGRVRRNLRESGRRPKQQNKNQPLHQLCAAAGGTETGAAASA